MIDNQFKARDFVSADKPKLQSPANRLADAVDRIDTIAEQLREILDDARGAGSSCGMAEAVPKPPAYLFWALHDAPDTIHKKVDECQHLIQEVRTLLFGEG